MESAVPARTNCPMSRQNIVDTYFMEHRAKLIDIAAFLDRIDRAKGSATPDFRIVALEQAARILLDGQPERAKRVLELFSDQTTELPQDAQGTKGATGVYPLDRGGA